jgi:ABC-type nickel/cobalt efflux system permease component RcnA
VGICGIGHVVGSVALGAVGLALGAAIGRIEALESGRADWAAWCMVAFGLAYGAWGVRAALRASADLEPHAHGRRFHVHQRGTASHHHADADSGEALTSWTLLVIFILGPCEPLLPLFVLPASRGRWDLAVATVVVFAIATVVTMLVVTAVGLAGLRRVRLGGLERWVHTLAGGTVAASGLAVIALGL